jgi:ketosteroid isomerase-like protein
VSEHPNATRLREVAAKLQGGDLDAFLAAYAEDGVYRVPGDNLVSGTFRGHDEIRDFFVHLMTVTAGTMRLEVRDVLADDRHAVMFWDLTVERQGRTLDASGAMAFRIDAHGKYSESWFLYNDQRAYDAFYS